jgi:hypothetical protein
MRGEQKSLMLLYKEVNPEQLLFGSHQFTCEKCGIGIMKPEKEQEIIVRGFGLYEDFEQG